MDSKKEQFNPGSNSAEQHLAPDQLLSIDVTQCPTSGSSTQAHSHCSMASVATSASGGAASSGSRSFSAAPLDGNTRMSVGSAHSVPWSSTCAHCGRETAPSPEITNRTLENSASSSDDAPIHYQQQLPSQEAARIRKMEAELHKQQSTSMEEHDEAPSEWIFCEMCRKWFHLTCVDVQEYEVSLIDKFHCPSCRFEHGDSILKVKRLTHRYAFDDENERDLPEQIGTEQWTQHFRNEYQQLPEATDPDLVRIFEDGHELMDWFDQTQSWTQPIKVRQSKGLGIKIPDDPYFDILDVIRLLSDSVTVDTIDVFAQRSYTMSLGRFYGLWRKRVRERLYNILSLEFSGTRLAELVRSPRLVRELSWVQKFWPDSDYFAGQDEQQQKDGETREERPDVRAQDAEDVYEFSECNSSASRLAIAKKSAHEASRPFVELFCLMGMRGSYTDFHIDFGGSSVWYHVFRGAKVFFIARPSAPNLAEFLRWQCMESKKRSETFFGDLLPHGERLYRLHVHQGETLLLPSGWIHSVYTPDDSLVFGGNFIHSLNVPMQIKVYEMEETAETEKRFRFPFFELCNFYAAKSIAETLKDHSHEGTLVDQMQLDAALVLLDKCTEWLREPSSKFAQFSGHLKHLQRELARQMALKRRLSELAQCSSSKAASSPLQNRSAKPSGSEKAEETTTKTADAEISQSVAQAESGHSTCQQSGGGGHTLDAQDLLDRSFSLGEEEEDDDDHEEEEEDEHEDESGADDEHGQADNKPKQRKHRVVVKQRCEHIDGGNGQAAAVVEIESEGPVRLKIKLPCWRSTEDDDGGQGSSYSMSPQKINIKRLKERKQKKAGDEQPVLNVGSLFSGRSTHGRTLRPSARLTESSDLDASTFVDDSAFASNDASAGQAKSWGEADSDFATAALKKGAGTKGFLEQFSPEEQRQIALAERAGELDARGELFFPLSAKQLKAHGTSSPKKMGKKKQQKAEAASNSSAGTSAASPKPPAPKKPKAGLSSRERLAKKLGLTGRRK